MLDPQTSGLVSWTNGKLLTIADGSAHESQRLKLIQLDPLSRQLLEPKYPIVISENVANSCFAEYLSDRPDLEALTVDPEDSNVFYTVTEDASRYQLSEVCKETYANSGSTPYPTVLVRLELRNDKVWMTHARPLRFAHEHNIANLPNDGIEGMTFGFDRTLYLGLEKDGAGNPRIFSVSLQDGWWDTNAYADVKDEALKTPTFTTGSHPINALTFVTKDNQSWIVAAARNDNQLWFIDPEAKRETRIISLAFFAETPESCAEFESMHNYSMEGIAVAGDVLWLVNDPWKENYLKNVSCADSKPNYEKMAPLLTSLKWSELIN